MNSSQKEELIQRYYGNIQTSTKTLIAAVDAALRTRVNPVVLDAGCGSEGELVKRFSELGDIYGVDLDCQTAGKLYRADLANLPFDNDRFDLIYSRSVFEHLEKPQAVMAELGRVLKPGGQLILITPNKYDYSSVVARFTPQWFHKWFVGGVLNVEYDMFPVRYRCNTPWWFRRLNGWRALEIRGLRHYPVNLLFSRILFRLAVAYDRLIDRLGLSFLQPTLFVVLEKPAGTASPSDQSQFAAVRD